MSLIEINYTECYPLAEQNPMTISYLAHTTQGHDTLNSYLDITQLLNRNLLTHKLKYR